MVSCLRSAIGIGASLVGYVTVVFVLGVCIEIREVELSAFRELRGQAVGALLRIVLRVVLRRVPMKKLFMKQEVAYS